MKKLLFLFLFGSIMSMKSLAVSLADTSKVIVASSRIFWKGTKMFGAGKHAGEIGIQNGYLISKKGALIGGSFTIDMKSLTVTDIPKTDPVPIRNLNNHLKSKDFFDVETYPTATFDLTRIARAAKDSLAMSGNLMMKGISHPVHFFVKKVNNTYSARIMIDRFKWNVGYTGSWVDKTLVDKEIELNISLVTN